MTRRVLGPVLGDAILIAEGARWRAQRRATATLFRREQLLDFLPAMIAAARCCIRVPPRSNFADYRAVLGAYVDDPSFVDVGSIDVEATGTLLAKIEIKATRGQTVSMSNRQGEEASNDPSRFWLCVVPLDSDEEIDELTPERVEGLARFVAGIGSRLASAREGYDAIGPLRRLAHERGVPIILVHHTRKMDADDIFDTVSGSHGLTGAADTILVLQRQGSGDTLHAVGRDIDQSLRNG